MFGIVEEREKRTQCIIMYKGWWYKCVKYAIDSYCQLSQNFCLENIFSTQFSNKMITNYNVARFDQMIYRMKWLTANGKGEFWLNLLIEIHTYREKGVKNELMYSLQY